MTRDMDPDQAEPTGADLAAIETEWPLIAAELDVLDAEIALLMAGHRASLLDWRRLRRAEERVMVRAAQAAAARPTRTLRRAA